MVHTTTYNRFTKKKTTDFVPEMEVLVYLIPRLALRRSDN